MRFAKLLRKSSNIQGKAHSASVFSASRLCNLCGLCVSASHWCHVHTDWSLSLVPSARTRRIKRTETRRGAGVIVIINCLHNSPLSSVLGVSNKLIFLIHRLCVPLAFRVSKHLNIIEWWCVLAIVGEGSRRQWFCTLPP